MIRYLIGADSPFCLFYLFRVHCAMSFDVSQLKHFPNEPGVYLMKDERRDRAVCRQGQRAPQTAEKLFFSRDKTAGPWSPSSPQK